MKKVFVLVEGPTEEMFVKNVLTDFFTAKSIFLYPVLVRTRKERNGKMFKGGISSYGKIKKEILIMLNDSSKDLVTTMIDYYALPNDFPGLNELPEGIPYAKAEYLERMFKNDVSSDKFLPYLSLHEFESLLFSDVEAVNTYFGLLSCNSLSKALVDSDNNPELINDGYSTHPSKRLKCAIPEYSKIIHGNILAGNIGMSKILESCLKFSKWIRTIEQW